MKIRNGFVSNSSSSSFVVAFDKKPESKEELQKLLFGDDEFYPNPYVFDAKDPKGWKVEEVTETVWKDMSCGPASEVDVRETFGRGYLPGEPSYEYRDTSKMSQAVQRRYYEEQDKIRNSFHQKTADEFLKENRGKVFYTFSYADEDGKYFSALEHGPLFERLRHFTISCH